LRSAFDRLKRRAGDSDEEVEEEEEEAQEEEEGVPGEAAAGELSDRVKKTGGDDAETRFAASLVEGAGGDMARKITP